MTNAEVKFGPFEVAKQVGDNPYLDGVLMASQATGSI
jgi:hypothetical protein